VVGLDTLNGPQRAAVLHDRGPLVVFAGAGSGKTRVITHRIARLVTECGVQPWRVLAVTFTNRAAGEMRERLSHLAPGAAHDLWVGTFHSVCARLLRRHADRIGIPPNFTIYDEADQRAMIARVMRDLGLDDKRNPPKRIQWAIGQAKQEGKAPADLTPDGPFEDIVAKVYPAYEERMAKAGALDFEDLIYRLVSAMDKDPVLKGEVAGRYSHVLVDEFQDTNRMQSALVHTLGAEHRNVCVVGDDDQSIYRWRGADRRNILEFGVRFPDAQIIKLEQNYRSTKRILRAAHSIISRNIDREPKELWTDNENGGKVLVVRAEDERDEARLIAHAIEQFSSEGRSPSDVAVFYRTHAQSRVLEEALRARNTPYRVVGGMRFYERAEVKDVLAYLRVIEMPDDDVAMLRIINTPTRGIGKTSLDRVTDAASRNGWSVWATLDELERLGLGSGPTGKLRAFRELITSLQTESTNAGITSLAEAVLDRTGYLEALRAEDTPEADARMENLRELVGSIEEFEAEAEAPSLTSFLELVTLDSSAESDAAEKDRVTLMTVHAAKGLEFPIVFVSGLEEGMFPMKKNELWDDPEELEEERRLAYVALTRARERLILSWASVRRIYGQLQVGSPSRFLAELPEGDVQAIGGSASRPAPAYPRQPAWSAPAAPRETAASSDAYVDYGDGQASDMLRRGMRVRHAKFGVGRVTDVGAGLPPRVSVDFPGWGTKQIVSTFLEPA
jgi:DNA helicase-2/ATP-dependent DNA helicase PcrA